MYDNIGTALYSFMAHGLYIFFVVYLTSCLKHVIVMESNAGIIMSYELFPKRWQYLSGTTAEVKSHNKKFR
jgi:hypothetical protein